MVPECCVCHAFFDVICDLSEYGVLVYLLMCVCLLCQMFCSCLMQLRMGGMCWLKPVATVLLMLCSAVFVECLFLNPCCVVIFGMFCVMHG